MTAKPWSTSVGNRTQIEYGPGPSRAPAHEQSDIAKQLVASLGAWRHPELARGRRLLGERRLEGDLGHAGQGPADRASRLGRLGVLHEGGLVEAQHAPTAPADRVTSGERSGAGRNVALPFGASLC